MRKMRKFQNLKEENLKRVSYYKMKRKVNKTVVLKKTIVTNIFTNLFITKKEYN